MALVTVLLFTSLVACLFRVWPRRNCRAFGIDSWYYLSYARTLRRNRRWPVVMPYYLLEQPEQVYPPGFPWLLSWFPTKWLERSHWWINAAIDAIHCALAGVLVWYVSRSLIAVTAAGMLFATSPILLSQATELNSRPLANVFLTAFMLSLSLLQLGGVPEWAYVGWMLLAVTATVILWTHKLTTQQMMAVLLFWSITHQDLRYLLLASVAVMFSIALSRGWFIQLIKGHVEIVRFWKKNLPCLGVHQVYASSLYFDEEKARAKQGVAGVRASKIHHGLAVGHLALVAALVAFGSLPHLSDRASLEWFLAEWVVVVFLAVFSTTWVPILKPFGEGFKYLRYGVFPWSVGIGLWVVEQGHWLAWLSFVVLVAIQVTVACHLIRAQQQNFLANVDPDTEAVLKELALQPEDGVLALPFTRCEAIVYFCGKKVLAGAHSMGWDRLAAFWPVLQKPIEFFLKEYDIHWLWVDTRYVDMVDLRLDSFRLAPWMQRGPVQLFRCIQEPTGLGSKAETGELVMR